jgi:predicted RNase H-like nuclease (RuvC/YqgF family)
MGSRALSTVERLTRELENERRTVDKLARELVRLKDQIAAHKDMTSQNQKLRARLAAIAEMAGQR